jgi:HEAT repeat protein
MGSDVNQWPIKRNDPRSTDELIQLALTEQDEDAAWEPVFLLHIRDTREVLDAAALLCSSNKPRERELGADILGQLGIPERAFPNECFYLLAEMLRTETKPDVLNSILTAFGHLEKPETIDLVLPFKTHAEANVCFGVVMGLQPNNDSRAIAALIDLSNDADADVRDWATFGLGSQIDLDSPAIRAALFARLADPDDDTQAEAMVGLARRKDDRVIALLIEKLSSGSVSEMDVEAAKEIGHPDLLSALIELKEWWPGNSTYDAKLLEEAIVSCGSSPQ